MTEEELQIVSNLTGVNRQAIKFSDDGFLSRGYIIDDGRIVFKFKKWPEISYQNEVKTLNFINSLNLGVPLQKVGWTSPQDDYLGIYGIVGKSIKSAALTSEESDDYGKQIGLLLKTLHSVNFPKANTISLEQEFTIWQNRFERSKDVLSQYFTPDEIAKMHDFIYVAAPKKLKSYGENPVFSHGDFCMSNIFVDFESKICAIDFSESAYRDEATDFMDMENDALCEKALDAYEASDTLRKKVAIRRTAHPMFTIGTYRDRPESELNYFVTKIRTWLST